MSREIRIKETLPERTMPREDQSVELPGSHWADKLTKHFRSVYDHFFGGESMRSKNSISLKMPFERTAYEPEVIDRVREDFETHSESHNPLKLAVQMTESLMIELGIDKGGTIAVKDGQYYLIDILKIEPGDPIKRAESMSFLGTAFLEEYSKKITSSIYFEDVQKVKDVVICPREGYGVDAYIPLTDKKGNVLIIIFLDKTDEALDLSDIEEDLKKLAKEWGVVYQEAEEESRKEKIKLEDLSLEIVEDYFNELRTEVVSELLEHDDEEGGDTEAKIQPFMKEVHGFGGLMSTIEGKVSNRPNTGSFVAQVKKTTKRKKHKTGEFFKASKDGLYIRQSSRGTGKELAEEEEEGQLTRKEIAIKKLADNILLLNADSFVCEEAEKEEVASIIYRRINRWLLITGKPFKQVIKSLFDNTKNVRFDLVLNTFRESIGTQFENAIADITAQTIREKELRDKARIDGLTGLCSKGRFMEVIAERCSEGIRMKQNLCLLMIDLDHFKRVNDKFNHLVGDFVLSKVADRMHESIRPYDVAARFGGEEFAVILPHTEKPMALKIAHRILSSLKDSPFVDEGEDWKIEVTASIGVASLHQPRTSHKDKELDKVVKKLITEADNNAYFIKEDGRCGVAHKNTDGIRQRVSKEEAEEKVERMLKEKESKKKK